MDDQITDLQKQLNWRTPGYDVTDDLPVVQVTPNDAEAFCKWLSNRAQSTYRLPTEAEWEYACRAGTTTHYYFGDDARLLKQHAWIYQGFGGKPEAVGTKLPNPFGLYDMYGNAIEQCSSAFVEGLPDPGLRVRTAKRGGSWRDSATFCRSAFRRYSAATSREKTAGIRCVCEIDAVSYPLGAAGVSRPVPVGVPASAGPKIPPEGGTPTEGTQPTRAVVPFDALRREDIPLEALTMAGWGDPARAPPELVAVYGEGRMQHWRRIIGADLLPDGRTAVSAGIDGTIRFWDVETGRQRSEIVVGEPLSAFAVSSDGATLAFSLHTSPSRIELWGVTSGTLIGKLDCPKSASTLAFSPDGQTLASGSVNDGTIELWSLKTHEATATLIGHTKKITDLAFNPDGKQLASGSQDGWVKVWDVDTAREVATLRGHGDKVSTLAVSYAPDGLSLVSGGYLSDEAPKWIVWNPATGEQLRAAPPGAINVHSIRFSVDGKRLFLGQLGRISALDTATYGQVVATTDFVANAQFTSIASSSNSGLLAAAVRNSVGLFDAATLKRTGKATGHQASLTSIAVSPDGRWVASTSSDAQGVNLWDVVGGETRTLSANRGRDVLSLAFSHDGRMIATGGYGGTGTDPLLQIWDGATGRELQAIRAPVHVKSLSFNPSGNVLAYSDGSKSIRLWDIATKRQTASWTAHATDIESLVWSPDGQTLISSDHSGVVRMWDSTGGRQTAEIGGLISGRTLVAVSPDGRRLATIVAPSTVDAVTFVQMWDAGTQTELATFEKPPVVNPLGQPAIAFSPDGRRLAVAAGGVPEVRICDVETGEIIRSIALNDPQVLGGATCVAFDATGRYLVTGNGNGTVYVLRLGEASQVPEGRD